MEMAIAFKGELRRQYGLRRSYRLNAIGTLLVNGSIFIVLTLTFRIMAVRQGVIYSSAEQLASLIGVLMWNFCMRPMGTLPSMMEQEAKLGTLEGMLLSPHPLRWVLLCRIAALGVIQGIETCALGIVLALLLRLQPHQLLPALPVILLTLLGAWGAGFALAGLTLVYQSVARVASLTASLALFLSGALVPLDALGRVFTVLKWSIPTTWGIHVVRLLMVYETPLLSLSNDMLRGFLHTLALLGIGWIVFGWGVQRARLKGSLSSY